MTIPTRAPRRTSPGTVALASGRLEARFLPEQNLLGVGLRLDGESFLALPGGAAAYRGGHTTGLPFLAPWANRLSRRGYDGVDLSGLDLKVDANGLPMHGTLGACDAWEVVDRSFSRLIARFEYARPELLAAFPFPHELEAEIEVAGTELSVVTTLRPTGDRPVPVSFGFHPYLRLPRGRRDAWRLLLPERHGMPLDARGIPTGERIALPAEAERLGARTFDDLFALGGDRDLGIEGGGRRITVTYGEGYPYAQVYAPPGQRFVCLEPMTAPTDALVTGEHPTVAPGESFLARFTLRIA